MNVSEQFPAPQRWSVLGIATLIAGLSLVSIYSAVTTWTSLPSNIFVALYFFVVLVVVPVLAAWAFVLAWQKRQPDLAMILIAIPALILISRAFFVGGL
jgi:hypothetical protein